VATAEQDLAKAMGMAAAAKADGLADPLVHHLVALDLKQNGRFDEAIVELGLGLQLEPENTRLMCTVGFCLLELDRRQEAAKVFGVAMKLDPRSADAVFGYGWAAERLGALESAESAFNKAVALNPDHADALAGLAGLSASRREWQTARAHAERAALLDPRQTDALVTLARIEIGVSDFDAAEERLKQVIALPQLNPFARANSYIMLGDALDGAQRYDEAFAAYARGKDELRRLHAAEFAGPHAAPAAEVVRTMLAEFLETPAAAWSRPSIAPASRESSEHAFLLGFPRSGTTLLEQVLATHPEIEAIGERPLLRDAEAEFLSSYGGIKRLSGVMSELLEPLRQSYWRRVREFGVNPAGKVFVDKHPLATFRLPVIQKMFPYAKIIFAMRDPRDIVLSCFRRSFKMNPSMYEFNSMERAADFYDAVMQAGEVYLETLPLTVHRVRYEDVVADFEGAARGLCEFLGVEWSEQLKDFARTNRAIATPSSTQVARGLYEEGVGQWRRYAFAFEPVMPVLQPWIDKFGYAAD
jgi:tetratricopeptide (TPR) repeat protein